MEERIYLDSLNINDLPRHFISMEEVRISMEEVKNYYAGRKGSPREVQKEA